MRNSEKNPLQLEEVLQIEGAAPDCLPHLAEPLLGWYGRCARILPWRENPTPYRVWVSEIMLQQTRVEAVKGYFTRFTEALPDIPALAAVPDDALLKLWEGLGYYSRARNMKRAANILTARYHGKMPASYTLLRELPGIGDYTAGAVSSIAFGIPVPAVDGNVLRVLSRILGSYADISLPAVKKAVGAAIRAILPEERPGDFNQALMELGATVCLPNAEPRCGECPVNRHCLAGTGGYARELPVKPAKKARRVEEHTVALLVSEGAVLLWKRPSTGLLADMYEPLNLEGILSGEEAAQRAAAFGARAADIQDLGAAKHIFTHVEWRMRGYALRCARFAPPPEALWANAPMLREAYALPAAFRAYTEKLPALLQG